VDERGARMTVRTSVVGDTAAWLTDRSHWVGDDGIAHRLLEHVGYSVLTVGLSALIAVPLGLWIGHTGRWRGLAVGLTGALRALPTLGLLTWFVLIAGIGLTAPTIALVILAIPPLLAGTYSGLDSLDRQTIDAARAVGFTEWQVLSRVEIPLALPLVVGGFRSAALQVISTATVAAYIGLGGLGRFLIDGQAYRDYPQMVGGSVLVIALALAVDGLFVVAQRFAGNKETP
jgi:osmoprotectant transport system permease protein